MKKKVKVKTTKWDVVEYIKSDEDMADYLDAAMEDGHPAVIATAIGNIARAKGMTEVARKVRIPTQSGHSFRRKPATDSDPFRPLSNDN